MPCRGVAVATVACCGRGARIEPWRGAHEPHAPPRLRSTIRDLRAARAFRGLRWEGARVAASLLAVMVTGLLFVLGLALLVVGADWLVKGASRVATAAGVSSLVIGLTVVAFGTSAPEFAVSVQAAWSGQSDMAVANVVGSNIFNVLFILGASALITPLLVAQQLVRRDVPLMIGVSVALWAIARDGELTRVDGAILFACLVAYTTWIVRVSRRETKAVKAEYEEAFGGDAAIDPNPLHSGGSGSAAGPAAGKESLAGAIGFVVAGLAMLVIGSKWLVDGAVAFATWAGLSEVVVGLTIVAAGTSLPEVATSITAALKGERDIAVGNVVGSNLFNILGVLGMSGMVAPTGLTVLPSMVGYDLPVMIAVAVACLPVFVRGFVIPRWEGALFLLYYVAYTTYLVLSETKHEATEGYAKAMLHFVLPLTGVTLGVLAVRVLTLKKPVTV
jgi:cation:H+ antiporter